MTNETKQTAVEWLIQNLKTQDGTFRGFVNIDITHAKLIEQAKEMEKEQKGYTLEQMMDCWNAALKFEPYGPGFNEHIMSLKEENNAKETN